MNAQGHFPDRAATIETWRAYVGRPENDEDVRANIMLAEPELFPPMFMAVAEIDVFRDAAFLMADRLRAAGHAPVLTCIRV